MPDKACFHPGGKATLCAMLLLSLSLSAAGCIVHTKPRPTAPAPAPAAPAAPARLPEGVRPLAYTLELSIAPKADRFSGRTQIAVQLDAPTQRIWLHGRDLQVSTARAVLGDRLVAARYSELTEDGTAALDFETPLPAGNAVLELVYDAPFDRQLKGLYRVDVGDDAYAFTQFEAISARLAFPSFDDPRFKTPFDVWLTVPQELVAASNAPIITEEPAGPGYKRVHFAQTQPLPTYLVAFAVGPLDVVDAPAIASSSVRATPLPLRGLAARGKGPLLAHALAQAGPLVSALEQYFGLPYPYAKLDIVAVPDFAAGAMENAGLVTFREWLLLIDPEQGTEAQRRAHAYVAAHEYAHQWFGNFVTMNYWDDIWLNEGFATWMGYRIVQELYPEHSAELAFLSSVAGAMQSDARVSARMIRQPITSSHDILNAFDSITYSKGGGVLAMFERYLGAETFRAGVQRYLAAHPFGNARTEDLLDALSQSAGQDVKTPFMTFLTQVGVPLIGSELRCEAGKPNQLALSQSRYLPLGSRGNRDQRWQVPVCARYEAAGAAHQSCTLLTEPTGTLELPGEACPSWVLPNAEGAGYYQFALPAQQLQQLLELGYGKLSARERYALMQTMRAGFESGSVSGQQLLGALPSFARDAQRVLAVQPMNVLSRMRDHIVGAAEQPALQAYARALYLPLQARLGERGDKSDDGDRKLLRADVITFLADVGNDAPTRKRMQRLGLAYLGMGAGGSGGLQPRAVAPDLQDLAVRMVVEEGDAAAWDQLYRRLLDTQEPVLRTRLVRALGAARDARSTKALSLSLDPALRANEVLLPLRTQLDDPRTREAAWQFFEQNFDALKKRIAGNGAGATPWLATPFCSAQMAARIEAFFTPRIQDLPGGPRSLEGAIEALHLCAAVADAQRPSVQSFFASRR